MTKNDIAVEIYTDLVCMLELSRTQIADSSENFSPEFLMGFESSYETFIDYLNSNIDEISRNK